MTNRMKWATRLVLILWAVVTASVFGAVVRTYPGFEIQPRSIAYLQQADTLERAACLYGITLGQQYIVTRSTPATSVSQLTTKTRIVAWCDTATHPIGMMHTHPQGQNCFYYFPTTQVLSSDGMSAVMQPYALDAILCRDTVVWFDIQRLREHKQPAPVRLP